MLQTMVDQEERGAAREARISLGAFGVVDSMSLETVDFLIGALVEVCHFYESHIANETDLAPCAAHRESNHWSSDPTASVLQWELHERCALWLRSLCM